MSHQPRRYFVVVLLNGVPLKVTGSNGARVVPADRTLDDVVSERVVWMRGKAPSLPLLGWRTFAGADKHRYNEPCDADDRAGGWAVRVYERRKGKLVST